MGIQVQIKGKIVRAPCSQIHGVVTQRLSISARKAGRGRGANATATALRARLGWGRADAMAGTGAGCTTSCDTHASDRSLGEMRIRCGAVSTPPPTRAAALQDPGFESASSVGGKGPVPRLQLTSHRNTDPLPSGSCCDPSDTMKAPTPPNQPRHSAGPPARRSSSFQRSRHLSRAAKQSAAHASTATQQAASLVAENVGHAVRRCKSFNREKIATTVTAAANRARRASSFGKSFAQRRSSVPPMPPEPERGRSTSPVPRHVPWVGLGSPLPPPPDDLWKPYSSVEEVAKSSADDNEHPLHADDAFSSEDSVLRIPVKPPPPALRPPPRVLSAVAIHDTGQEAGSPCIYESITLQVCAATPRPAVTTEQVRNALEVLLLARPNPQLLENAVVGLDATPALQSVVDILNNVIQSRSGT
eukprot:4741734-Pleurochrysis_carterae.AAC.1